MKMPIISHVWERIKPALHFMQSEVALLLLFTAANLLTEPINNKQWFRLTKPYLIDFIELSY